MEIEFCIKPPGNVHRASPRDVLSHQGGLQIDEISVRKSWLSVEKGLDAYGNARTSVLESVDE